MRILIADCTVIYTGRGDTKLKHAKRLIMLKKDGTIAIHHDKGVKPLNYMSGGGTFIETLKSDGSTVWVVENRKENLTIHITQVWSDTETDVDENNSELIRDGTEKQLQEWLTVNPEALGEGFTVIGKEVITGAGAVDILALNRNSEPVAVEVKRTAMLGAVDQASRYVEALKTQEGYENITGMVAALDVRPNTIKLAEKRNIAWVQIEGYTPSPS